MDGLVLVVGDVGKSLKLGDNRHYVIVIGVTVYWCRNSFIDDGLVNDCIEPLLYKIYVAKPLKSIDF